MTRMPTRIALIALSILIFVPPAAFGADASLTWLGQSAFKVVTPSGKVLYIDPWIANPVNPKGKELLDGIDKADLILITHGHADHVGNASAIARKTGARLVATFDLGKALVQYAGFPEKQFDMSTGGSLGGKITLLDGDVSVAFIPALHGSTLVAAEGSPMAGNLVHAGIASGFLVTIKDGPTVYHTGDTDLFSDMALVKNFAPVDVMLLCIGDKFTMGPAGAARAVVLVKPKVAIPMHYGTFPALTGKPEDFIREVKAQGDAASGTTIKVLSVGETYAWKK